MSCEPLTIRFTGIPVSISFCLRCQHQYPCPASGVVNKQSENSMLMAHAQGISEAAARLLEASKKLLAGGLDSPGLMSSLTAAAKYVMLGRGWVSFGNLERGSVAIFIMHVHCFLS